MIAAVAVAHRWHRARVPVLRAWDTFVTFLARGKHLLSFSVIGITVTRQQKFQLLALTSLLERKSTLKH